MHVVDISRRTASGRLHPHAASPHSSDAPSPTSTASTDGIECPNCDSAFTGKWQKTNFNRHLRLKHAGETIVQYACEDDYCARSFNRKDARLKHYRKAHPHLSSGPPILRGPQSLPEGDQTDLHHVQGGHSQNLPVESQGGVDDGLLFPLEDVYGHSDYQA